MKRKPSAASILAQEWGWSSQDVQEHRYQYGRTPTPVYAFDDGYYTVSPGKPKTTAEHAFDWQVWAGNQTIAAAHGTRIWHAK